jgi:predicted RNA binding protein with dsRBD fold (UPF0201 family)
MLGSISVSPSITSPSVREEEFIDFLSSSTKFGEVSEWVA